MYYWPDTGGCGCESASVGIRVIKGGTVLTKKEIVLNAYRNTC